MIAGRSAQLASPVWAPRLGSTLGVGLFELVAVAPLAALTWAALSFGPLQQLDSAALLGANHLDPSWRDAAAQTLRSVHGFAGVAVIVVAALISAWWARRDGVEGRVRALTVGIAAAVMLAQLSKWSLERTAVDPLLPAASFPSGHTVVLVGAVVLLAASSRRVRWAPFVAGVAAVIGIVVVASVGHRPTDVIAAIILVDLVTATQADRRRPTVRHFVLVAFLLSSSIAVAQLSTLAVAAAGVVTAGALLAAATSLGCTAMELAGSPSPLEVHPVGAGPGAAPGEAVRSEDLDETLIDRWFGAPWVRRRIEVDRKSPGVTRDGAT